MNENTSSTPLVGSLLVPSRMGPSAVDFFVSTGRGPDEHVDDRYAQFLPRAPARTAIHPQDLVLDSDDVATSPTNWSPPSTTRRPSLIPMRSRVDH